MSVTRTQSVQRHTWGCQYTLCIINDKQMTPERTIHSPRAANTFDKHDQLGDKQVWWAFEWFSFCSLIGDCAPGQFDVSEWNESLSLARALRAGSNRTLTVVRPPGKSHSLFEYLGISFAISWFVYSSDHSHSKSDPPSATSLANKMTSNSEVISLHFQTWEEHSMIWYFNDEQSVISHFLYQQLQSHT